MIATLIPFPLTGLLNVRELGIAVAAAVLLNVLIVRPVLLPAAATLLGRHGWLPTVVGTPAHPRIRQAMLQPLRLPRPPLAAHAP